MTVASARTHTADDPAKTNLALMFAPVLLSVGVVLIASKSNMFVAAGAAAAVFAVPMFLLPGNLFARVVYCFFLFSFTLSHVPHLTHAPFFLTAACLIFWPLALKKETRLSDIGGLPNVKPMALMLLGCAVSVVHVYLSNYGKWTYTLIDMYRFSDAGLLLGIAAAYALFVLFKLDMLDHKKVVSYIAASGIAAICFALVLGARRLGPDMLFREGFGAHVFGANALAMYLDITLPCAFFLAFFEKKSVAKKTFYYAMASVQVCALLLTGSRGSLPCIAVMAAYAVWRRRSKRLLFAVAALAVIAVPTLGAAVVNSVLNPAPDVMISNLGRLEFLNVARRILEDNRYFFGTGMGSFTMMKFDYGFPLWFDPNMQALSHNSFVEIWLGWGLLGLVGWLLFNGILTVSLLRKNKNDAAAVAVAFAIIMFSIHGLVDTIIVYYPFMITYFALVGAGLFIMSQNSNATDIKIRSNDEHDTNARHHQARRL